MRQPKRKSKSKSVPKKKASKTKPTSRKKGPKLYEAIRKHDFAETTCFLCGRKVPSNAKSKEHVIPKWILRHFDLWNQKFTLINGTKIAYRDLVIPCCKPCNTDHLSKIEVEVQQAFLRGADSVREMDRELLMLWVGKIFYGLLYREIFLPFDRKKPKDGSIIVPEDMEQFQMLHFMLQASRVPIRFTQFDSDIPASIYVFDLLHVPNPKARFDYKDDILNRALYLRMGTVGILASFDLGAQTVEGRNYFPKYQKLPLHPIQFEELGADFFLKARKFNRYPKIVIAESPGHIDFTVLPIAGMSMRPVFDEWQPDEKAEMLMHFLGYPREIVMPVEGRTATWLINDDGTHRELDLDLPPYGVPSGKEKG